jgi:cell wall-associated NlpC family hydrolase
VAHGEEVHFAAQTQPGDLAFFSNAEGRVVHVGIMLSGQQIMHAHGEVRIDTLDHNGIYNVDQKRYTHQLRIIKRILI